MNKLLVCSVLLLTLGFMGTAHSTERMYGVVGLGYADTELGDSSAKEFSYRLALGHQFHRQWYVELGYQQLVDDSGNGPGTGLTANALTLSALGKAANRSGELFYRIGAANVDVRGESFTDEEGVCEFGSVIGAVADLGGVCAYDEGVIAAVFGLGFDYHLGLNTMLRLEGEYMLGEDDFSTGALYIGLRYNFN